MKALRLGSTMVTLKLDEHGHVPGKTLGCHDCEAEFASARELTEHEDLTGHGLNKEWFRIAKQLREGQWIWLSPDFEEGWLEREHVQVVSKHDAIRNGVIAVESKEHGEFEVDIEQVEFKNAYVVELDTMDFNDRSFQRFLRLNHIHGDLKYDRERGMWPYGVYKGTCEHLMKMIAEWFDDGAGNEDQFALIKKQD